jgi:hypothetical protein
LKNAEHNLLCFGHFGSTKKTPEVIEDHERQIHLWIDIVSQHKETADKPDFLDRITDILIETDTRLHGMHRMEEAVKNRERMFIHNSIRGILGYVKQS